MLNDLTEGSNEMSSAKKIRDVQVTYDDGTVVCFQDIEGYHSSKRNNLSHEKDYKKAWIEHQINWRAK